MFNAQPKISKTSKMPARSWSLQALDTCPASRDSMGDLVDACKGCYATTGMYAMPSVKAPREWNREDWQKSDWVDAMVSELDNDRYFRWLDSGDMYHLGLAHKILEVCQRTPWVKHWIPTRMYKFLKFAGVLDALNSLPNVVLRVSSDSIVGEVVGGWANSSTIVEFVEDAPKGAHVCPAYSQGGKCGTCRACWDKAVPVVVYPAHGRKMAKVIMMKKA